MGCVSAVLCLSVARVGAVSDGWECGFPQVVTPELVEQLKAFQAPSGPLWTGIRSFGVLVLWLFSQEW